LTDPVDVIGAALGSLVGFTGEATVAVKAKGRPDGQIVVTAVNLGDANVNPEAEPVTIADKLPAGMLREDFKWEGSLEDVRERAASQVEKVLLESTMRDCKWNKTRAAERLGISPKTLLAKLRGAGLEE